MIMDNFKDILKHTHGLSFITDVKLTGDAGEEATIIGAIAEDKSVVLYGALKNELEDLRGGVIGLARMSVLQGYLNFEQFKSSSANVSIVKKDRNGEKSPVEIKFDSGTGHVANYRFMGGEAANEIQIPKFKSPEWDVSVTPSGDNLKDLSYFAGILGGFEPTFSAVCEDGNLEFRIGSGGDRTVVPIATDVDGELEKNHSFPLAKVLSILKLGETGECEMYISDRGALMITVDSGIGVYQYIIPAMVN